MGKGIDDMLYQYLVPRIVIAPLNHCQNEMTYLASEISIYGGFVGHLVFMGQRPITLEKFRESMMRLFPEPHAKFSLSRREWWGFRFSKNRMEYSP